MPLAEKLRSYIQHQFPEHAEIVDDGGLRMRISWTIPLPERPNHRATPIAIHFDGDLAEEIENASPFELENTIGPRFSRALQMMLIGYRPNAGVLDAWAVFVGMESIGR